MSNILTTMTGTLEGKGEYTGSKYRLRLAGNLKIEGVEYFTTLEGEMNSTMQFKGLFRLKCMADVLEAKLVGQQGGMGAYKVVRSTGCFSSVTGGPVDIEFAHFSGDYRGLKIAFIQGPAKLYDGLATSLGLFTPEDRSQKFELPEY